MKRRKLAICVMRKTYNHFLELKLLISISIFLTIVIEVKG